MESADITIVTDGLIDLVSGVSKEKHVVVVPCSVQLGREIITGAQLSQSMIARQAKKLKLSPPSYAQFLRVYQELGSQNVISIHPSSTRDGISHQARLARNLLMPHTNIKVFEAKTVDIGVGFLVRVAAETARDERGYVLGQILLLLQRLQTEMMHTLILTTDLKPFKESLEVDRWCWIKNSLPGMQALLSLDPKTGSFRLVRQGRGLGKVLDQWDEVLKEVEKPCEVWIRYRGFDREIQPLQSELSRILQPESLRLEKGEIMASPLLTKNYVEILLHPSSRRVEEVKRFTRRLWKAYGLSPSSTPPLEY